MSNAGNGEKPPEEASPDAAAPAAQPDPPQVAELANTGEGCWKVVAGGEKVELTPAEWRRELARLFSKSQPPG